MYMLKSVISIAVLTAAHVAAQSSLAFTSVPTSVVAGNSYTVTWTGGDSSQPVSIILRSGNPQNLDTVATLTSSATGGSYTWNVPTSITNLGTYALQIQQGTTSNYSPQFAVSGGTGTALPAASSAAATTASASAAASTLASSRSASASAAASSLSSALSSASASASAAASSAASTSASKASASATASASKASASASSTTVPTSDAMRGVQSPIALIFGAVAALFYLA